MLTKNKNLNENRVYANKLNIKQLKYVHIKILDNNKVGKNKIASLDMPPKKSMFDLGSIKF